MCLLIVAFQDEPGWPLVVGANRDERYDRPATAVQRWDTTPVVLAGRDEESGGTWLSVNEHGVVAGLTNQPSQNGRDPSKRTRGELPLLLTAHRSATDAVAAFSREVDPAHFNACSILVGDRERLFAVEIGSEPTVRVIELAPGRHVLENRPIGIATAKTEHVRHKLDAVGRRLGPDRLRLALIEVLSDHSVPEPLDAPTKDGAPARAPERMAADVHGERYGTRSSSVIEVADDRGARATVWSANGHPCETPFEDVSGLWDSTPAGRTAAVVRSS